MKDIKKYQDLLDSQIQLRNQMKEIAKALEQMDADEMHTKISVHLGKFYRTIEKYHPKSHSYHHVYLIKEEDMRISFHTLNVSYWEDNTDDFFDINTCGGFYIDDHSEEPFEERYVEVAKEEFVKALEHVKSLIRVI